jgi:hypothetical protein
MAVSADLLRLVPLFRGLTDRSFEAIASLASETRHGAGDVLVRQGGPGDFLGEISLVDGSPRTATVTALDAIDALCIHRDGFIDLIDRIPVFRLEVFSALTQRIRATSADPLG